MNHDLWLRRACWCFAVLGVLVSGTLVRAQAPGFYPTPDVYPDVYDGGGLESTYWVGLICEPASAALRSQLKLKESGLVVREVVADAPAGKAGVKTHDILLAIGDTELKDPRGLVEAVEKSEGKEITLSLVREGEKMTLKVTPTKRDVARAAAGDLRRRLELHRLGGGDGIARWQTLLPGAVPASAAFPPHKLPKDMSVTIVKEGESPAKITVKQGDKKWEVTEDKLKELPDEVRRHVTPMVRPGTAVITYGQSQPTVVPAPAPIAVPWNMPGFSNGKLEKQVDELKKQIEKLQKAVDELAKPRT